MATALVAVALLTVGCEGHGPPRTVHRAPSAQVAILPVYSIPEMNRRYLPLIQRVTETTGLELQYVSSLNYDTYLTTSAAEADFGLQNALVYVQLTKTQRAWPLARALTPQGKDTERGVIIAHPSAGIEGVEDLKAKRVLVASRRAVAGCMAQAEQCLNAGLDPERDLLLVAGIPQDDIPARLAAGDAHAAFTRESVWASALATGKGAGLRLVTHTAEYPTWCFAALGDVDPVMADQVRLSLLTLDASMPADRAALEAAGVSGFAPVTDVDYVPVRRLAERLNIPY